LTPLPLCVIRWQRHRFPHNNNCCKPSNFNFLTSSGFVASWIIVLSGSGNDSDSSYGSIRYPTRCPFRQYLQAVCLHRNVYSIFFGQSFNTVLIRLVGLIKITLVMKRQCKQYLIYMNLLLFFYKHDMTRNKVHAQRVRGACSN
jgi:hypothetical protein